MSTRKAVRSVAADGMLQQHVPRLSVTSRPLALVPLRTVLVVDERAGPAAELTIGLQRAGFQVQFRRTLRELQRSLKRQPPVAIVVRARTDAGISGPLQALKDIAEPVPVILMLDDLSALPALEALDLPLTDFLVAPHTAAECVQRVEHMLALRHRFVELSHRAQLLEHQSSVDFKTGLISELYFRRILQLEWKRAARHGNPLSLLLLDVDDFKSVNDSTEYEFGDRVLQKVGETLRHCVRETDFAARLGGDEFCVLLPQTRSAEALATARRIAACVAAMTVQRGSFSRRVTVSIGVDTYAGRGPTTLDQFRLRVNKALHESKRYGKNQVRCAPPAEGRCEAQAHYLQATGSGPIARHQPLRAIRQTTPVPGNGIGDGPFSPAT